MPDNIDIMTEKEQIKSFIVNNKLKEAMELIVAKSKQLNFATEKISLGIQADLNEYYDKVTKRTADSTDLPKIRDRLFDHVERIYTYLVKNGNIVLYSEDLLIEKQCLPFINRTNFRNILKTESEKVLKSNCSSLIFVNGSSRSGISYLEKYLTHLCSKFRLFEVVNIDIPHHLDNPNAFKGNILMEAIKSEIGLEILENDPNQDTVKFARFTTKLREKLEKDDTIKIFFIHDFHRIENSMNELNLQNFVYELVSKVSKNFPKSIFILTGYKYEDLKNWRSLIRPTCAIYQIEPLLEDDIKACLSQLYTIYETRICKNEGSNKTETEFVHTTLDILKESDGNYNLQIVGEFIMDYIFELRNN